MLKYRAALGLYLALYTLRIWSVRVTRLGIIIPKASFVRRLGALQQALPVCNQIGGKA